MLPADLRRAEAEALTAIQAALGSGDRGLWTAEFRFEGLRILPLALRLLEALRPSRPEVRMLLPDAGATALAKRDAPDSAPLLGSLRDQMRLQQADGGSQGLLVLVGPTPADYDAVEQVCALHRGLVLMLNGSLEDAAVGIGSVARERRRGFLADWQSAYALIPLAEGALRRAYPEPWQFYRRDPDGHRFVADFEQKPDGEQRAAALAGEAGPGLAGNLQAIDAFLEGLRN
ncbi:DUF1995 family protein [Cyanobium sp. NIES-981]|uniref:DUF1995 family protein n=1 Tax=Cyanobium sp. NIES-981 TaxID=1851505 RepID=UPI0007DD1E77|nr:DUF1995 family protein [Cyanobium sp. NIES-981]SBO42242.1 conserved protein of unknown function [Cyanobium sp. NIES-981]